VQLLISDANILIDLEEGQLVELMFRLPYHFSMPDILFYEELEEEHEHLLKIGLNLSELSSETMQYAMELIPRYAQASRNDCFALALAAKESCPLLTGDKALRKAAENESVMVRGTLWLVEMMVKRQLVTTNQAREAYQQMKTAGRRLPWQVAEAILQELEKER
jgi:predicted nucleic acid-binding protein